MPDALFRWRVMFGDDVDATNYDFECKDEAFWFLHVMTPICCFPVRVYHLSASGEWECVGVIGGAA